MVPITSYRGNKAARYRQFDTLRCSGVFGVFELHVCGYFGLKNRCSGWATLLRLLNTWLGLRIAVGSTRHIGVLAYNIRGGVHTSNLSQVPITVDQISSNVGLMVLEGAQGLCSSCHMAY